MNQNQMSEKLITMKQQAQAMLSKAYAPYSQFLVGVCLETDQGHFYNGCNIENVSYSLTICAEACAIANMVAAGEKKIESIVLISSGSRICSPCGACRQMLAEFGAPETQVHMFTKEGLYHMHTLQELLPLSFNQKNLSEGEIPCA